MPAIMPVILITLGFCYRSPSEDKISGPRRRGDARMGALDAHGPSEEYVLGDTTQRAARDLARPAAAEVRAAAALDAGGHR